MSFGLICRIFIWLLAAVAIGWGCLKMVDLAEESIEKKKQEKAEEIACYYLC